MPSAPWPARVAREDKKRAARSADAHSPSSVKNHKEDDGPPRRYHHESGCRGQKALSLSLSLSNIPSGGVRVGVRVASPAFALTLHARGAAWGPQSPSTRRDFKWVPHGSNVGSWALSNQYEKWAGPFKWTVYLDDGHMGIWPVKQEKPSGGKWALWARICLIRPKINGPIGLRA